VLTGEIDQGGGIWSASAASPCPFRAL